MNERERLIGLLENAEIEEHIAIGDDDRFLLADYLLENGVVVLLRDGNDFNPDLYCPYCGNNLSNTRVFDKALKGGNE